MNSLFFPEKLFRVCHVEDGQIQSLAGRAFLRDFKLTSHAFNGGGSKIFHHAHTGLGFENHYQHALFINVDDEDAEFVALLINAVKIRFIDQAGDGLISHERAGGKRGDGGQIEVIRIALMRDEKAALVNDQCRRCVRRSVEFSERFVKPLNVVFNELG